MQPVDFRSDTITRPDASMRRAMAEAVVGDDVFRDDPTVSELEVTGASLLGQEAAIFCPSGTMANQIAARVHAPSGSEVLLHEGCHIYRFEQGGLAALHGIQAVPLAGPKGQVPIDSFRSPCRPDDPHYPVTRLIVLENTHNLSGGSVLPLSYVDDVVAFGKERGLRLHLDGARLGNAAVALGVPLARLARGFDSVTLCLSKGLGAPIGTLLAGSTSFIAAALRVRKLLGGGMRQAGVLAAPGLLALRQGMELLSADHRRARALASSLSSCDGVKVLAPESNILVIELPFLDVPTTLAALEARGVRALAFGPGRIRFVFHRDLDDAMLAAATEVISEVLAGRNRRPTS